MPPADQSQTTEAKLHHRLDNAIGAYREMVFFRFAAATTLILTPFVVYALMQGNWKSGTAALLTVVAMLIDAIAIYRGKQAPVPPAVIFLPIILAIVATIPERGIIGILWAYPALFMAHFILEKRIANIISAILLLLVIPFSFSFLSTAISLRVLATLVLTVVFANIFSTAILKMQKKLHDLATIDPLTGTYNRRYMETRIAELIKDFSEHEVPASMLMVDLDHFKKINDQFGHDVGDMVLQETVNCMKDNLRNGDDIFRLGGEEFVALLPQANQEVAEGIAGKIRHAIASRKILDNMTITVSIGGCEFLVGQDSHAWLKRCDRALYDAKENGRNRVVMYNEIAA